MPVRRLVCPRIAALAALLCIFGLVLSGCTWTVSFTFRFGRSFFESYVEAIRGEDWQALRKFYAPYVWIESECRLVSRDDIIDRWIDYFRDYEIQESSLIEWDDDYNEDGVAIIEIERYEERWCEPRGPSQEVTSYVQYVLQKMSGHWRITRVWLRDEDIVDL